MITREPAAVAVKGAIAVTETRSIERVMRRLATVTAVRAEVAGSSVHL
jgi:hypothetical protein